jgi:hypothetical protein
MGSLGVNSAFVICGGNPQRCDEDSRGGTAKPRNPALYYPAEK